MEDDMTGSHSWRKRLACGLGVAGAWIVCGASAQESATHAPPARPVTSGETAAAPAASPQSGLIACIDPETGELVAPGEDPACRQAMEAQRSAVADRELEEEPVATGGFKVDLEGRFMQPLYATVKEGGDVEMRHGVPTLKPDK
jgi:hypothetical protein